MKPSSRPRAPRSAGEATLGLDFGTESVRAVLIGRRGEALASATVRYAHGQIVERLPGSSSRLPAHFALQHPGDWMASAAAAARTALRRAAWPAERVLGLGVDFTSCTMLPARRDGTPLCLLPGHAAEPHAWPKLWKHHGAQAQTDRINAIARRRREPFLARYGGLIGLEWLFPKMLEVRERAPRVFAAADLWLEAGDWFVWQLVGGDAAQLPRSTCQAGYKGMWSARDGWPAKAFLRAVHPDFASLPERALIGRMLAPGQSAGGLSAEAARRFGLKAGTPVSAAIIDAHAGVPGAGAAEPGTLVMVLGTSSCHMLNSDRERLVPGVAGIVKDGILPGYYGYETGQAAVGDAFDWVRRLTGQRDFRRLSEEAAALSPGADGVRCLDWFNGCRTPLMDGSLKGAFAGLALHHGPAHLYRALLEASACGLRWIVELLRDGGVPVEQFVATGGLPHHNPLVVQVYADMLGAPIRVHPSNQGPALGAAILGALAGGLFTNARDAIRTMARPARGTERVFRPSRPGAAACHELYSSYRTWASAAASASGPA